ncbi:hypothetical protein D9M68_703420 [compost metagenome]
MSFTSSTSAAGSSHDFMSRPPISTAFRPSSSCSSRARSSRSRPSHRGMPAAGMSEAAASWPTKPRTTCVDIDAWSGRFSALPRRMASSLAMALAFQMASNAFCASASVGLKASASMYCRQRLRTLLMPRKVTAWPMLVTGRCRP